MPQGRFLLAEIDPPDHAGGRFRPDDIDPTAPDFRVETVADLPRDPGTWARLNTPLVPQIGRAARWIADTAAAPRADQHLPAWLRRPIAMQRGLMAGAAEGVGNIVESVTSPVGLALTAAGLPAGRVVAQGLVPAVRGAQKVVQAGAGGIFAGEGVHRLATAPTLTEQATAIPQIAGGLLGMASVAQPLVAARRAKAITAQSAQTMGDILRALPPTKTAPYQVADWTAAKPYLNVQHRQAPITTTVALRDALDASIDGIEGQMATFTAAFPTARIQSNVTGAVTAAFKGHPRGEALSTALRELDDLQIDAPRTLGEADALRLQLNAENKAVLKRNHYDVATARKVDPGFAAREVAARVIRDDLYGYLESRGVAGVRQLRRDEGSIIKLRNATERQIFSGTRPVGEEAGYLRRAAATIVRRGAIALGAVKGGPGGAVSGALVGEDLANMVRGGRTTRDALIARAFTVADDRVPVSPTVPPQPPVAGLLGPGARPMGPSPDTSYVRSEPATAAIPERLALPPGRPPRPMGPGPDPSGRIPPTLPENITRPPVVPPPAPPPVMAAPAPPARVVTPQLPPPVRNAALQKVVGAADDVAAGEFYTMSPDDIGVDASRFQFKAGTNTEGVTGAAKIEGPWNEARSGVLMVWKDPANGHTYVVNGHHRLDAAKRLGAERVAVRYLDAPDARTARIEGALTNIAEGKGEPLDAAKLIRDAGFSRADLLQAGLSSRSALLREGVGLATLSDPLFARVVAGEVSEAIGSAIGQAALSPEGQAAVIKLVERQQKRGRNLTPSQVRALADDVNQTPEVKVGGDQPDIFSLLGDERTQNVAVEKAVLKDWARQQLMQDKRLFGFVSKEGRAEALARGGNTIDAKTSRAISTEAGQVASVFDRLANVSGTISQTLNAAAVRIAEGVSIHEVRQSLLSNLRKAVAEELGTVAKPTG